MTLAETVLAIFLSSLLIMALFQLIPGSAWALKRAECRLQAGTLATANLEAQVSRGFQAQVRQQSEGPLYFPDQVHDGVVYSSTLLVREVPGIPPAQLREVECRVEWQLGQQRYEVLRVLRLSAVRGS